MKKIFAFAVVAMFALAMVSCGGKKKAAEAATEPAVEAIEAAPEAAAEVVETVEEVAAEAAAE